jgi:beta-glucosidase
MTTTFKPAARLGLPQGFRWGVSTSSYQIEGAVNEDGRGPSIWDTHIRQQGRIKNNETAETACDHYHRFGEDVALMKRLGVDAYRFSVAWPRLMPHSRAVNEKGLAFYDRLIDALLEAGIEPWLCLYHWDLPQWLDDQGGWLSRDMAGHFADYAALIARRYGDRVKHFATFNEFSVFTLFGYGFGWNAPAIAGKVPLMKAIHHVNLAHGDAIAVLRSGVPGASLGAVHNRQVCYPADKTKPEDHAAAGLLDEIWNLAFCDPQILGHYSPTLVRDIDPYIQPGDMARIAQRVDWFGLNHYGPIYARGDATAPLGFAWADGPPDPEHDVKSIGWAVYPEEFRDELVRIHQRYHLPIYVTENGTGQWTDKVDDDGRVIDPGRVEFLEMYTDCMKQALNQGADVRGYFIWSLLDNFEWGSGYGFRFGIVYVDFETQKRTPKASFDWYASLIQAERGEQGGA